MEIATERLADLRVKYLEMVQSIVSRMASNGAAVKTFCITIVTTVSGFAITLQRPSVAIFALLPVAIFALLDAQFLRIERRFRGLFDRIRIEDWAVMPSFDLGLKSAPRMSYFGALSSWSISSFYGVLAGGIVIVTVSLEFANVRSV